MRETIFITGADKGLGLALTGRLLELGFTVFAGHYQTSPGLDSLREQWKKSLSLIPLDVTDDASVKRAWTQITSLTDHLDILLNNAGIHLENHRPPLVETDLESVRQTFEVNALGSLRITKAFHQLLLQGRRKLLVNISSEAGSLNDCWRESEFGYCMSKAALNMQSRILQNSLGKMGIQVLLIHPGWMRTDMGGNDADIHPNEAALAISTLILQEEPLKNGMYIDYHGEPLRW